MPKLTDEQLDELFELYRDGKKAFGPGIFPRDEPGNRFTIREAFPTLTDGVHQLSYETMIRDVFADLPEEERVVLEGELIRRYANSSRRVSKGVVDAHPFYLHSERQIRKKLIADQIRGAYDRFDGDIDRALEWLNDSSPSGTDAKGKPLQEGKSRSLRGGSETAFSGYEKPRKFLTGRRQQVLRGLAGRVPRYGWAARIRG